jgi:hypothetical protein
MDIVLTETERKLLLCELDLLLMESKIQEDVLLGKWGFLVDLYCKGIINIDQYLKGVNLIK